jgi:glycerate 2-kinase
VCEQFACSVHGVRRVPASPLSLREHALLIWQAALDAVKPEDLVHRFFTTAAGIALTGELTQASRIVVVGAGKAGAAMSRGLEACLPQFLDRISGVVNVPANAVEPFRKIVLHAARPAACNQPTVGGVVGAERILDLVGAVTSEDVVICLFSGGGSALLPAPVPSVGLADKQRVTLLLHECGATIQEMNTVRKHLSRIKGGQLARAFRGRSLHSLIISDVVGDALDVIASGPTATDPTTFTDALSILRKYGLCANGTNLSLGVAPASVLHYLERGAQGKEPETLKNLPHNVHNHVIGNNVLALAAAESRARALGYDVVNMGTALEGETRALAKTLVEMADSIRNKNEPVSPPASVLCGGETTVALTRDHGLGGRNQEFVLAALQELQRAGAYDMVVLSGGTDGEDGPTDAAGACADLSSLARAKAQGLKVEDSLDRHDAYHFFEATGDLLKTGLTQTNVMDVRVILVA